MGKKLVIVGGGIAGITAGIYARMSGFETTIIEKHSLPGGNCTSWRRNGYLFEGAIHWLSGTSPRNPDNLLWRETGALNDMTHIYNHDPYLHTKHDGIDLYLYRDLNKLEEHFLKISPDDLKAIKKLSKDIKCYSTIKMPLENEKGVKLKKQTPEMALRDIIAMLPALMRMGRHMKISIADYAKMFKHAGIHRLLTAACPPYFPAMALLFFLATMSGGDGGYPEGGSLEMIQRMVDTYKSLGGELLLNTKAEKIIVKNDRSKGVQTGGNIIDADCVIVAMDTITAVNTLFDSPPDDSWIADITRVEKGCVCTFAGIGVKADLSHLPHSMVINMDETFEVAGEKMSFLSLNNYAEYKNYAPEGSTALTVILGFDDTYEWWKNEKTKGTYQKTKETLKERLENILAHHIPETSGKIEVIDIATPLTYERYTGSWHGSYMCRMEAGAKMKTYPCNLQNVKNIFFAGQRTKFPGGLPPALESGRRAVQLLCKEFNIIFQNEVI
jgi:phytoene dehydrogenase-like protein